MAYFQVCEYFLQRLTINERGSERLKSERRRVRTLKVFSEHQKSLHQKERQKSDKLDFRRSDLS